MIIFGLVFTGLVVGFLTLMFEGNIRLAIGATVALIVIGAVLDSAGFNRGGGECRWGTVVEDC